MIVRTAVFVLLLLWGGKAAAQEALVLSGGGARGLAHAGVIEGLLELGYDPDIVVGTSMGALVGALYAAGYTPEEIRQRILDIDWNQVFGPTPVVVGPDRSVRYPMFSLDMDVEQFRAARGLMGQWRINRALARLLFDANARARGDFDRLARRYRAVAADLTTGEAVVLAEGDLARAARASMAVPGAFAPVLWGDRVLVDGGITNNLPTDIARELGATRVIAVEVSRPPEEIGSLAPLAVLSRTIDLIQENTQRDPVPPDELVLPQLDPGLTGASFPADPRPLFEIGLEAARRDLPPSPPDVGRGERPLPLPPDSLHDILIEAPDSSLAALARSIFRGVAPGPYDPDRVLEAVDLLYGTGLFEAVWPRVVENPDTGRAAPVLLVRLDSPPELSLAAAAGYENDRGARAWASLDGYTRIGPFPVAQSAAVQMTGIERSLSLSARIYPRSRASLAWSTGAYVRERDVRLFMADALRNYDVRRFGVWAGLDFPHILRDRVGSLAVRSEWIDQEEGESGFSIGPMVRYTSVNPDVLIVGEPFLLEGEARWGTIGYSRVGFRGSQRVAIGPLLMAGVADLRLTTAGAPADVLPALGDQHAVPGFQWGEVRGHSRAVAGFDVAYPIMSAFLRLRARAGTVGEPLPAWGSPEWVEGAQLGIVWLNPLVSVEWGFGANTRGDNRFDISLGRRF